MILTSNSNNNRKKWLWLDGGKDKLAVKVVKHSSNWSSEQVGQLLFWDDHNRHIQAAGLSLFSIQGHFSLASDKQLLVSKEHAPFSFAYDISDSELKSQVANLIGLRKVEPLLKARVSQLTLQLRDDETKCVARAHFVKTTTGIFAQIESIRGYDKATKLLVRRLQKQGFRDTSKLFSHHLYQSLASELPQLLVPETVKIEPQEPIGDAVCRMCLNMLSIARSHEQGVLNKPEDTEFLHDYRVSLRKTRSLVSLMKNSFPSDIRSQLQGRLAELMRPTNLARDLDVYLLEQSEYEKMLPENLREGLPAMFEDFRKQHVSAYSEVHRFLKSRAYETEVESCKAFFEGMSAQQLGDSAREPVLPTINKLVKKKYRKIIHFGNIITPESPDEEVHDLRLECKKFRYLLEFFGQLYPSKKLSQLVKNLKRMQNTLGLFNDYSVQQEALHHYLSKARLNKKLHMSIGALILVLAQKQLEQRKLVEKKFVEFASSDTAALINALFSEKCEKPIKTNKSEANI